MIAFGIWTLGLLGIVGTVCYLAYRNIQNDSWTYDEEFIWVDSLVDPKQMKE